MCAISARTAATPLRVWYGETVPIVRGTVLRRRSCTRRRRRAPVARPGTPTRSHAPEAPHLVSTPPDDPARKLTPAAPSLATRSGRGAGRSRIRVDRVRLPQHVFDGVAQHRARLPVVGGRGIRGSVGSRIAIRSAPPPAPWSTGKRSAGFSRGPEEARLELRPVGDAPSREPIGGVSRSPASARRDRG